MDGTAARDDLTERAQRVVDRWQALGRGERGTATTVTRAVVEAVAEAGLLGLHAPVAAGGLGAATRPVRRVQEILAEADLQAWFVQVQHHSVVRAVAAAAAISGRHEHLLRDLARGRVLAGTSFAHLRRHPARALTAVPLDDGGWRLHGIADWFTGWGVHDLAMVAAQTDDDRVVRVLLPAVEADGLQVQGPLALGSMTATATVRLHLDGVRVGAGGVVDLSDGAAWRAADRLAAADVVPAVFGLITRGVALLRDLAASRGETAGARLAGEMAARRDALRVESEASGDADPADDPEARVAAALDCRARAHALLRDAATAVVVAAGGVGVLEGHPARRLLDDAMFLLVQGSTVEGRAAVLRSWGSGAQAGAPPR